MCEKISNIKELHRFCDKIFIEIINAKQAFANAFGMIEGSGGLSIEQGTDVEIIFTQRNVGKSIKKILPSPKIEDKIEGIDSVSWGKIKKSFKKIWEIIPQIGENWAVIEGGVNERLVKQTYVRLKKTEDRLIELLELVNDNLNAILIRD